MGNGIEVDSWVKVDGACAIEYQLDGDQVGFRLGGTRSGGLDLIFTDEALEIMVKKCTEALRLLNQAADEQGDA